MKTFLDPDMAGSKNVTRLLIFDNDDKIQFVVHRSMYFEYLARLGAAVSNEKLSDMLAKPRLSQLAKAWGIVAPMRRFGMPSERWKLSKALRTSLSRNQAKRTRLLLAG